MLPNQTITSTFYQSVHQNPPFCSSNYHNNSPMLTNQQNLCASFPQNQFNNGYYPVNSFNTLNQSNYQFKNIEPTQQYNSIQQNTQSRLQAYQGCNTWVNNSNNLVQIPYYQAMNFNGSNTFPQWYLAQTSISQNSEYYPIFFVSQQFPQQQNINIDHKNSYLFNPSSIIINNQNKDLACQNKSPDQLNLEYQNSLILKQNQQKSNNFFIKSKNIKIDKRHFIRCIAALNQFEGLSKQEIRLNYLINGRQQIINESNNNEAKLLKEQKCLSEGSFLKNRIVENNFSVHSNGFSQPNNNLANNQISRWKQTCVVSPINSVEQTNQQLNLYSNQTFKHTNISNSTQVFENNNYGHKIISPQALLKKDQPNQIQSIQPSNDLNLKRSHSQNNKQSLNQPNFSIFQPQLHKTIGHNIDRNRNMMINIQNNIQSKQNDIKLNNLQQINFANQSSKNDVFFSNSKSLENINSFKSLVYILNNIVYWANNSIVNSTPFQKLVRQSQIQGPCYASKNQTSLFKSPNDYKIDFYHSNPEQLCSNQRDNNKCLSDYDQYFIYKKARIIYKDHQYSQIKESEDEIKFFQNLKKIKIYCKQSEMPQFGRYKVNLTPQKLRSFSSFQLKNVKNIKIKNQYGQVHFQQPINLFKKRLPECLLIEQDNIQFYDEEWQNKHIILKFRNFGQFRQLGYSQRKILMKNIKRWINKSNMKLIKHNYLNGDLTVQIDDRQND